MRISDCGALTIQSDVRALRTSVVHEQAIVVDRLERLSQHLGTKCKILVVSTPTVASLYQVRLSAQLDRAGCRGSSIIVTTTEATKTLSAVERVCRAAEDAGLGRGDLIIAFGGGVCCDIAGFAAAIYRRGIAHVKIPTTLLAQVDAGIGAKNAVNVGRSKSALGTFWPPTLTYIDPSLLTTVPARHIASGFGEIVKLAIVRDAQLFARLERLARPRLLGVVPGPWIIKRAVHDMVEELARAPFEVSCPPRAADFGHFLSPDLESRSDYRVLHGEAVAIEIAFSVALAAELRLCTRQDAARVVSLLLGLRLPGHGLDLTAEEVMEVLGDVEVRRGGRLNWILPKGIGDYVVLEHPAAVPGTAIRAALHTCRADWLTSHNAIGGTNEHEGPSYGDSAQGAGRDSRESDWTAHH